MAKKARNVIHRKSTPAEKKRNAELLELIELDKEELRQEARQVMARNLVKPVMVTLRGIREASGKSLSDLEKETKIRKATLSKLENGVTQNPTLETLHRIATALGKRIKVTIEDA